MLAVLWPIVPRTRLRYSPRLSNYEALRIIWMVL